MFMKITKITLICIILLIQTAFIQAKNECEGMSICQHLSVTMQKVTNTRKSLVERLDAQYYNLLEGDRLHSDELQDIIDNIMDEFIDQQNGLWTNFTIELGLDIDALPKNCDEALLLTGEVGLHDIKPLASSNRTFQVLCHLRDGFDNKTTTWAMIQRRMDGSVDFFRDWTQYQNGFGNTDGEFFLGLENIYTMTQSDTYELWVELGDFEGQTRWAMYDNFKLGNIYEGYMLKSTGYYWGSAGDSLDQHVGMKFSTKDVDNDNVEENCAILLHGAWWYNACAVSDLNGPYFQYGQHLKPDMLGITWGSWRGHEYSLKYAHMSIRPKPKN